MLIIISIIFILLLYLYIYLCLKTEENIINYICSKITNLKPQKNIIKKKWAILLTTAINVKDISKRKSRKDLYNRQISKWLKYTNLDIFIVESTGADFDLFLYHPRITIIRANISNKGSSSQTEARSIKEAIQYIGLEYNYILKVTGRYFLKGIEYHLKKVTDVDIVLQKHCKTNWQNSEYFGGKREVISNFIETVLDKGLMEERLYDFIVKNKLTFKRIGPFPNNIRRGGDNLLIKNL